jgi:predicted transcriptional regulator
MSKRQYTIELPPTVSRRIRLAAKKQDRDPADLAVEAIGWYFSSRNLPVEAPTAAERRAIRRGEAAFKRGDYVTLDDYFRSRSVGNSSRRTRKKVS